VIQLLHTRLARRYSSLLSTMQSMEVTTSSGCARRVLTPRPAHVRQPQSALMRSGWAVSACPFVVVIPTHAGRTTSTQTKMTRCTRTENPWLCNKAGMKSSFSCPRTCSATDAPSSGSGTPLGASNSGIVLIFESREVVVVGPCLRRRGRS